MSRDRSRHKHLYVSGSEADLKDLTASCFHLRPGSSLALDFEWIVPMRTKTKAKAEVYRDWKAVHCLTDRAGANQTREKRRSKHPRSAEMINMALSHMLLPQAWLRKIYLRRALQNYPPYDPPHKVEEYLLSRERATENFDYFMRVREQRIMYFRDWLRRYFWVRVTMDEKGVRALNRWGNKYAGLLLVKDPASRSYFSYEPAWVGEYAGNNALFDMGMLFGECLVACCPNLRWEIDPVSVLLPRTSKQLKQTQGASFQRPSLTGFDDPVAEVHPLHQIWTFAHQMKVNLITFEGLEGYLSRPRFTRERIRFGLLNSFKAALKDYPAGDPYGLRKQMPLDQYLAFIDSESEDEANLR